MTIATELTASPIEEAEPIIERIGVDDPKTAHGGRSRTSSGPPISHGLVVRSPQPVAFETKVRRIPRGPLRP